MSWDFSTDPDFQEQLDWMNEFVQREIWPLETIWRELDDDGLREAMAPLQEQVRARNLWAAHLPPELGGQGMGQVRLGLMHEILGTSPIAPLAFGNAAPDSGNSEILALAGTPEQKERWLHPLLAGDLRSAFSMTEPNTAGSDPTQLSTRAVRDGEEWVIDGLKWFSSNGSIADFLIVMAVTDPDARPYQRASMFIVPRETPGLEILRDVPTMEHPGEHFGGYGGHAEIRYDSVRVGPDALLGSVGEGFVIAQHRLGPGRIHHCMRLIGMAERALEKMCKRALGRVAFGKRIADRTVTLERIADARILIDQARLLTLDAAWRMDTVGNKSAAKQIAMIKVAAPNMALQVLDWAIQAHGAGGVSDDFGLAYTWAHARTLRLADGPDEVHRNQIAKMELGEQTSVVEALAKARQR